MPMYAETNETEYLATRIFDYIVQNMDDMDIGQRRYDLYKLVGSTITIGRAGKIFEIGVVQLTEDEKIVSEVSRRAD
jgi:hypothetical protein